MLNNNKPVLINNNYDCNVNFCINNSWQGLLLKIIWINEHIYLTNMPKVCLNGNFVHVNAVLIWKIKYVILFNPWYELLDFYKFGANSQ